MGKNIGPNNIKGPAWLVSYLTRHDNIGDIGARSYNNTVRDVQNPYLLPLIVHLDI